jgi:hypothetical protein
MLSLTLHNNTPRSVISVLWFAFQWFKHSSCTEWSTCVYVCMCVRKRARMRFVSSLFVCHKFKINQPNASALQNVAVFRRKCVLWTLLNHSFDPVQFNPLLRIASHSLFSFFNLSSSTDIWNLRVYGRFSKHRDDDTVSSYLIRYKHA